jgi:thiol-disulfide isomerase/thioredoxin
MTNRRWLPRWGGAGLAAIVATVLVAACSTSSATRERSAAAAGSATAGPRGVATGPATFTTLDGSAVRVPDDKPSVLVFLSITCADCSDAARTLARVEAATNATARAAHLGTAKARFLGVDSDRDASAEVVSDFLHSVGANGLAAVLDPKYVLFRRYQVTALSTVLVIDSAGRVTFRAINPSPAKILSAVTAAS